MNDLYIMHYGVGHDKGGHSGRYPWGSGKNPFGETHGKGTKDIWKENRKVARKNAAKVGIGTVLGGPIGMIAGAANTKNSDLRNISRYNYIGNGVDLEGVAEAVEENIMGITGVENNPNWDWDVVNLAKKYIKNNLKKYPGSEDEAIKAFINDPKHKGIKEALEYAKKDREESIQKGKEFVKKMSDVYDLKTLYDINKDQLNPDQKRIVNNAQEFVKKVINDDFPSQDIVDIFKQYYKGLRTGAYGNPDGDY